MLYINSVFNTTSKPSAGSFRSTEALITNISLLNLHHVSGRISILLPWFFISTQITISDLEHTKSLMFFSVIMAYTSVSAECTDWWNSYNCLKCQQINLLFLPDIRITRPVLTTCTKTLIRKPLISYGPVISPTWKQAENDTISVLWWICTPEKSLDGISLRMQMWNWLSLLFRGLTKNETLLMVLCSILTEEASIQPLHSGSFWIPLMLYSLFPKKAIPLTMPAVNASSSILRKKKQTVNATILYKNFNSLFLNILKGTTIPKGHTTH